MQGWAGCGFRPTESQSLALHVSPQPPPQQELGGAASNRRVLAQRQQQRLRLRPYRRHSCRQQAEQEQGALQDQPHQVEAPRAVGLAAKGLRGERRRMEWRRADCVPYWQGNSHPGRSHCFQVIKAGLAH